MPAIENYPIQCRDEILEKIYKAMVIPPSYLGRITEEPLVFKWKKKRSRKVSTKAKSERQKLLERRRRIKHIKRGMEIAFHEANQVLKPLGIELQFKPEFIPYTIALAEAHRHDATADDKLALAFWEGVAEARRNPHAPVKALAALPRA